MKKVIAFLATALLATSLFANEKNYMGFWGLGFSTPIYNQKIKGDGSRTVDNVVFNINVLAINKNNGFTAKANLGFGYATTNDITLFDNARKHGLATAVELGLGYSFIREEDKVFSLLATFNVNNYHFFGNEDYICNGMKLSDSTVKGENGSIGLEGLFIKNLSGSLYFYGGLNAYFIFTGNEEIQYENKDSDLTYKFSTSRDIKYGFGVTPKFGFAWKF